MVEALLICKAVSFLEKNAKGGDGGMTAKWHFASGCEIVCGETPIGFRFDESRFGIAEFLRNEAHGFVRGKAVLRLNANHACRVAAKWLIGESVNDMVFHAQNRCE